MGAHANSVAFKYLHKLLNTDEQSLLDGVVSGTFSHPTFGPCIVSSWQNTRPHKSIKLEVVTGERSTIISSEFLTNRGVDIDLDTTNHSAEALSQKCHRFAIEERLHSMRLQSDERIRSALVEEAQRRKEIHRLQDLLEPIHLESETVQDDGKVPEATYKMSLEDQERIAKGYDLYKSTLEAFDEKYRQVIMQQLAQVLPDEYELSTKSVARLAIDWYGEKLPDSLAQAYPLLKIDPFLVKAMELGSSHDLWTHIDLIKHFRSSGYYLAALKLSFRLEGEALSHKLRDAVLNQRLIVLSVSGLGVEADELGRDRLCEENMTEYFAFTLWGHYRRWPELDPKSKIRNQLRAFFKEIGESPESVAKKTAESPEELGGLKRARISEVMRQEMRSLVEVNAKQSLVESGLGSKI